MKKIIKSIYLFKVSGFNLIGLMVASALGAFILSVIVKVTFTVSNNFQIIKATTELETSARMLNNFFNKVFLTNGYNNLPGNINSFKINPNNPDMVNFSLWFAGGIDGALTCSGQPVNDTTTTPINVSIFLKKPTASIPGSGYITCQNSGSPPLNGAVDGSGYTPLINQAQVADFYVVSIMSNPTNSDQMANLEVVPSNITSTPYNSFGIKLAILLRSTSPVFNINRTVSFSNIFNSTKVFNNTSINANGDKYLYKLVIIESPFIYTDTTETTAQISY